MVKDIKESSLKSVLKDVDEEVKRFETEVDLWEPTVREDSTMRRVVKQMEKAKVPRWYSEAQQEQPELSHYDSKRPEDTEQHKDDETSYGTVCLPPSKRNVSPPPEITSLKKEVYILETEVTSQKVSYENIQRRKLDEVEFYSAYAEKREIIESSESEETSSLVDDSVKSKISAAYEDVPLQDVIPLKQQGITPVRTTVEPSPEEVLQKALLSPSKPAETKHKKESVSPETKTSPRDIASAPKQTPSTKEASLEEERGPALRKEAAPAAAVKPLQIKRTEKKTKKGTEIEQQTLEKGILAPWSSQVL